MTAPDRIWIETDDNPYYYEKSDLDEAASPVTEYVRADIVQELIALIRDAIEDEDEFETEWNKSARAALARYRGGITSA